MPTQGRLSISCKRELAVNSIHNMTYYHTQALQRRHPNIFIIYDWIGRNFCSICCLGKMMT